VRAVVLRSGAALTSDDIELLPQLRHVVRAGSGTDNIDLDALRERSVTLHRNADASAQAVAEWALLAVLSLLRRTPLGHDGLQRGEHLKAACLGKPLATCRVAIWGAGPIGRATYDLLRPMTAEARFAAWPSAPSGLPQAPAAALQATADVHVIALPLRPETARTVSAAFLSAVADRCPVIVCAGRFGTLDFSACLAALHDGALGGLAVDAIDPHHVAAVRSESPSALNLLTTPHVGAQRTDVRETLDAWVITTLLKIIKPGADHDGPR
jgi:D-3-phosphoglycerate dehydrogenase